MISDKTAQLVIEKALSKGGDFSCIGGWFVWVESVWGPIRGGKTEPFQ